MNIVPNIPKKNGNAYLENTLRKNFGNSFSCVDCKKIVLASVLLICKQETLSTWFQSQQYHAGGIDRRWRVGNRICGFN